MYDICVIKASTNFMKNDHNEKKINEMQKLYFAYVTIT